MRSSGAGLSRAPAPTLVKDLVESIIANALIDPEYKWAYRLGSIQCRCRHSSYCSPWPAFTVALPFCHLELRAARRKPARYPNEINSLGDHIRARRLDLKLLQTQVADQIGVHELTITGWERNATIPEVRYMPGIIQFLGYNPLPAAISLSERLSTARRTLGLSQRKMAAKLGVDPATLMGWEAGRHQPSPKKLKLAESFLEDFVKGGAGWR